VFIKHKPGIDLDFFQPQIRRLVSSAVEGLQYSAVTVVLVEAAPTRVSGPAPNEQPETVEILPGLTIAGASRDRFWQIAIGMSAALILLSAFSIAFLVSAWRGGRLRFGKQPAAEADAVMMVEPS
jgi:type III secretion protein J